MRQFACENEDKAADRTVYMKMKNEKTGGETERKKKRGRYICVYTKMVRDEKQL